MSPTTHPGLPVDNPITSYWLKDPHPLASYRSSPTVPQHCDIAIIGTGLAGVATAYHILSTSHAEKPSVVLLEARQVCSGATGRNGGHTKLAAAIAKPLYDDYGDVATQVINHQLEQLSALKEVVDKESIDCDLKVTRSFDVFFEEDHAREIREFIDEKKSEGVLWAKEVEWIEGSDVDKISGVMNGKGALIVPAISLWPYKLVTALLSRVLELGGQLYTETRVTRVEEGSNQTTITTSRGTLTAEKTIFATNAYTAALLPQYEGVIPPFKGQNSHLAPLPSFKPPIPLDNTYNLRFNAQYADYLIPRPDGTIILGGAKWTYDTDRDSWWNTVDDRTLITDAATAHFDSVMAKHFRGWENASAYHDMVWSGIMGYTPDTLPHVGRVPGSKSQWILAGFNGAGMLTIFTVTQAIAKMVDGVEYEDTGLPVLFKSTPERLAQGSDKSE
ncbi:FAD dependent oxidoreductase [Aspergillus sclerotioniger CBS 115572]|uniref:FAD dependent oxidoreductase n=1 Tax=Aspergillus sclerotioniger CBS 115572 TaxID=1450535 RepID=A0A317VP48_9EURO|nr:FAD dependent oxidoreductase [Aspergillus sclerotioniger CBS 115572]PWY76133.1 FAD dependent oxidoreductase [Aspergillus sclerotioniger CBS 115572]